jgi:DNA-binding MarR family transcriptional regulator
MIRRVRETRSAFNISYYDISVPGPRLTTEDYRRLLALRTDLRQFLAWSELQAAEAGLTPAHHQLLLAIRGHEGGRPTVGDLADYLVLRHHSVVGLVDRAEAAGLVARSVDDDDHRVVRVRTTSLGARRLEELSALHLEELSRLAPSMRALWSGLERRA